MVKILTSRPFKLGRPVCNKLQLFQEITRCPQPMWWQQRPTGSLAGTENPGSQIPRVQGDGKCGAQCCLMIAVHKATRPIHNALATQVQAIHHRVCKNNPPQPQGYPPQPQGYPQPSASNSVLPLSIDSLCCVCRLSKSVILLRPCNHLCLCEGCSKEEAGLLQEKCPICRETILDSFNYYKVFTS